MSIHPAYKCAICDRRFPDEAAIRAHQDVYQSLHKIDPGIEEHDGQPWIVVTAHVLPELNTSPDLIVDMAADLCTLAFERPEILAGLRPDVRRLALYCLTNDRERAYEFNKRYALAVGD